MEYDSREDRALGGRLGKVRLVSFGKEFTLPRSGNAKVPVRLPVRPGRYLARPTGPEARFARCGCDRGGDFLRFRWYRIRRIRVTMYRWEGTRLPYALLRRGTLTT